TRSRRPRHLVRGSLRQGREVCRPWTPGLPLPTEERICFRLSWCSSGLCTGIPAFDRCTLGAFAQRAELPEQAASGAARRSGRGARLRLSRARAGLPPEQPAWAAVLFCRCRPPLRFGEFVLARGGVGPPLGGIVHQ